MIIEELSELQSRFRYYLSHMRLAQLIVLEDELNDELERRGYE